MTPRSRELGELRRWVRVVVGLMFRREVVPVGMGGGGGCEVLSVCLCVTVVWARSLGEGKGAGSSTLDNAGWVQYHLENRSINYTMLLPLLSSSILFSVVLGSKHRCDCQLDWL